MQHQPLKSPCPVLITEVIETNSEKEGKDEDWMTPCRDCVFRNSDDGCALGCSLLILWTGERIKG